MHMPASHNRIITTVRREHGRARDQNLRTKAKQWRKAVNREYRFICKKLSYKIKAYCSDETSIAIFTGHP